MLGFRFTCVVSLCVCLCSIAVADENEAVPLKRLVMFSSGVGFFEHAGTVEGTENIELEFGAEQINDLLKSLVVSDRGGSAGIVSYGSRDPITRTLKTFSIDLTQAPSLSDLLSQVRGEKIEVQSLGETITGTILSIESRAKIDGETKIDIKYVTLVTDDGLRSVSLDQVGRIKLLDKALNRELSKALAVLATARGNEKKSVSIEFRGEGKRDVGLGYVREMPIWKTSYRLVMDEEDKAYLQGWAIVENTTESDWDAIDLSLVSGRPVSFRMDLYQPLYVQRPLVVPELYASLVPPKHDQNMSERKSHLSDPEEIKRSKSRLSGTPSFGAGGGGGSVPWGMPGTGRPMGLKGPPHLPYGSPAIVSGAPQDNEDRDANQDFGNVDFFVPQSRSMAEAEELGELFQYQIAAPVTLGRQKSAMLPIISEDVEAERVSVYNENVLAKHPMRSIRLINNTDLHLMQGPVTIYDDGGYAGDSQFDDISPGNDRLLSYAVDLNTEVSAQSKSSPTRMVSIAIKRGVVYTRSSQELTRTYTIKNSGDEAESLLIEYPLNGDWKLVEPEEPAAKTRDRYRFAVEVPARETKELLLRFSKNNLTTVALGNKSANDRTLIAYMKSDVISDEVKAALEEVVRQKTKIAEFTKQRQQAVAELNAISKEQERIRRNMQAIDRNTELYTRYITKLGEQEDRVDALKNQIEELQQQENAAQRKLNEYLNGLTIE
ncbi:hypothetical protein [Stratiformator vulcanicus]|uniref:DUF4139 domain-containing protein n=1 Tax=Stratiformator vulcanicus TaxID=2527980 RepID=A0A517QYA3_9PLAN|nr:hypothetical protein [Stratiformator vulcanicus]QDT36615.1 hypothetical protein Pan189_09750 [Stratiformator vulcanicus]